MPDPHGGEAEEDRLQAEEVEYVNGVMETLAKWRADHSHWPLLDEMCLQMIAADRKIIEEALRRGARSSMEPAFKQFTSNIETAFFLGFQFAQDGKTPNECGCGEKPTVVVVTPEDVEGEPGTSGPIQELLKQLSKDVEDNYPGQYL